MQFGVTKESQCHYLSEQQERLAVVLPEQFESLNADAYQQLMQYGFRRSHNDVYRPHCQLCSACQSLRVVVPEFHFSKNQKRIIKKNADLKLSIEQKPETEYSELFSHFIEKRHSDGEMYPPDADKFWDWVSCDWLRPELLEWRNEKGELLIVSVVDPTPDAMSAVYTFFHPEHARRSPGTYAVLEMIRLAQQRNISRLYLGYQIDGCKKMNYKARFAPYERLVGNHWKKELKSHLL
ncbi:arginyltransferase [Idiomarina aminovorans]|uniref:arginyltransferase n=1 Tax=Idiomarina aminovorans TaxID=2914829 RepID=UPI0020053B5E|nr:arginyltransferase [Idiomarina sp. ATCH4]